MKKALVFVLAVVLVMSMAVPAYAATSPVAPKANENTTAALPEVVADTSTGGVLVAVEDVKELPAEAQETFVAAQETLKEEVPTGMKTQYFCYYKAETTADTKTSEPATLTLKIANVTKVVVKQFVDGKWVELVAKLDKDGNVIIEGVVDGPLAIFTA